MTDINLKTLTPDTSLPTTGFLFGADSQATASPSVYGVTTAITTILGNAASSDALVFNSDTTFSRGAIRNFRFGAADAATALAQTLSVQSVVAGTSNTAGTAFTINGSQGTGSGAGGSIVFQVASAGGSGTAQNTLVAALTIDSTKLATFTGNAIISGANNSLAFPTSGIASTGTGINIANYYGQLGIFSGSSINFQFQVGSGGGFTVTNTANFLCIGLDTFFWRDAANTFAQRNGTAAQEFRVYENATGSIYKAILGNRQLMKISGASFTDGAGASAGTLTNAPAVGNPTKWIPIDDNGTTRYIPAW